MNNFWDRLTLFGVKTEYGRDSLRELRIINAINFFFIVLFTPIAILDLSLFYSGKTEFTLATINAFTIVILGLLNLILISQRRLTAVKLMISFGFPFLLLILPLLQGHVINEFFFWYPYVPTAFSIGPHLLFRQKKHSIYLYFALLIYLIFAAFSDQILIFVGNSELSIVPIVIENMLFYKVASISIFLFINASILYFLEQSKKYENSALIGKAELEEQREELKTQNEILLKQGEELKEKNIELEQLLNQLKKTQSQLIQTDKMASLGTLTTGVATEINNPLKHISKGLEKLETVFDDLKTPALKEPDKLKMIDKGMSTLPGSKLGVERISRIVRSLLSFSEHKKNSKTDIHKVINSILMIIGYKFPEDLTLEKRFADDLPELDLQQDKIHQAILAVLDNALFYTKEHSDKNGKIISISTNLDKERNQVGICIANNGPAIDSKNLDKIFDPFFTTKPNGKGLGLGLTNAYNNISSHNGEIFVSKNDDIVEFTIKLPIENS